MKILYLTIILLISILYFGEFVNSEELREEQKAEIEIGLNKRNSISKSSGILKNIPKIKIDTIKTKVSNDNDIFSYKNIERNINKIYLFDFKLIGLTEIDGVKSILISSSNEIKSFKEGEIINSKFKIKEVSFKPAYVIFQKDKDLETIYLNK